MKSAMSVSPERTIRKFNPGTFQSDEEVIEQFVVRERELGIAMEVLRGNIDSPSCQHLLIVAPRGRGKTMLLARAAAEMRTNDELSERLLPVRFMEESHEIISAADFWLETLFYLAREVESCNADLAQELRKTHGDLTRQWRGDHLEERAQAAVLDAADRLKRQLVLMVENLQAMNDAVDVRFGWKLRAALQTEPQVMLLATATTRFKELDDVEQPFFELFRVLPLDPLDTKESRTLWQMVSGDKVRERAIRPLEILTGGDPRLIVIMAQFGQQRSLRKLLEHLVSLVDDHTEYFRAHLEGLAKTERRVYLAVVDLWQPSTAGEIAARGRMDIRNTSSLLGRLVDRGVVAVDGTGKARRYVGAQRLYSIYYKMRHEREGAAVVNRVIDFMIAFYSTSELVDVLAAPVESTVANVANAQVLIRQGIHYLDNAQPDAAIEALGQAEAQVRHLRSGEARQVAAAAIMHKQAAYLQLDDPKSASELFHQVEKRLDGSEVSDAENLVAMALNNRGNAQMMMGCHGQAVVTFDQIVERCSHDQSLESRRAVARALLGKGRALTLLGRTESALDACNELAKKHGDLKEKSGVFLVWRSLWIKATVRLHEQRADLAGNIFRGLYGAFDPANHDMLRDMTAGVIQLVTNGMAERAVIDILMMEQEKADALAPLVAALRQRQGDAVRAPAEVCAVAEDICREIESGEKPGYLVNHWTV